jgi:hypothetical protein
MSKHTPGPWRLDDPINAHVISDRYHTIEAGGGFLGGPADQGFHIAAYITPADAALIAVAPDMYELVKRIAEGGNVAMSEAAEIIRRTR